MNNEEIRSALQMLSSMNIGSINQLNFGDGCINVYHTNQSSDKASTDEEVDAEVVDGNDTNDECNAEENDDTNEDGEFERIKHAVMDVVSDAIFKGGRDFSLLRVALEYVGATFTSSENFLAYLRKMGIQKLPGRLTIDRGYATIRRSSEGYSFADNTDTGETLRRNNIMKHFLGSYNKYT